MNNLKIGIISISFLLSGTALAVNDPNTEEPATSNVTATITTETTANPEPEPEPVINTTVEAPTTELSPSNNNSTEGISDTPNATTVQKLISDHEPPLEGNEIRELEGLPLKTPSSEPTPEVAKNTETVDSLTPTPNPVISNNNSAPPAPAATPAPTASEPEAPKFPSYQLATTLRFKPQTKSNARSITPSEAATRGQDLTVYLRVGENKASLGNFTCIPNPNHDNNKENPNNIKPNLPLTKEFLEFNLKTEGVTIKEDIKLEGGMQKEGAIAMLQKAGIFEKEVPYVSRKKNSDTPWYKPRTK